MMMKRIKGYGIGVWTTVRSKSKRSLNSPRPRCPNYQTRISSGLKVSKSKVRVSTLLNDTLIPLDMKHFWIYT
jgi:hypothetical protein